MSSTSSRLNDAGRGCGVTGGSGEALGGDAASVGDAASGGGGGGCRRAA
eukprot:COSAG04_NODE_694_length_11068_cov_5.641718_13_plen_48_part_01